MSVRARCARTAALLALGFYCLFVGSAHACSVGAVNLRELNASSDLVVIGYVHIIEEHEETAAGAKTTTGIAEIEAGRVLRSRIARAKTYRFAYQQIEDEGCVFGLAPIDGEHVKAWLRRSSAQRGALEILYFEPAD